MDYVVKRYKQQRNRGTEGFGFYLPEANRLAHNTRETKALRYLKKQQATEVLWHHRYPTSTDNVRNGCHPYTTGDYFKTQYIMAHNGVISNAYDLKREHEKLGIRYVSEQDNGQFNDSEALMWDIALTIEGEQTDMKAEGRIAFIMVEMDGEKRKRLYYGRNTGSPLVMSKTSKYFTLASEYEGDKGTDVATDTLFWYNYSNGSIGKRDMVIPTTPTKTYTTGNYSNGQYTGSINSNFDEIFDDEHDDWGQPCLQLPHKSNTFPSYTRQPEVYEKFHQYLKGADYTRYLAALDLSQDIQRLYNELSDYWVIEDLAGGDEEYLTKEDVEHMDNIGYELDLLEEVSEYFKSEMDLISRNNETIARSKL